MLVCSNKMHTYRKGETDYKYNKVFEMEALFYLHFMPHLWILIILLSFSVGGNRRQ